MQGNHPKFLTKAETANRRGARPRRAATLLARADEVIE